VAYVYNPLIALKLDKSGGGAGSVENFSYTYVPEGTTVQVPETQEMFHTLPLVVDGTLDIDGAISQEVDYSLLAFSWRQIGETVTLRVKEARNFLFTSPLTIEGILAIDGTATEV
jgi:hypothetical protein